MRRLVVFCLVLIACFGTAGATWSAVFYGFLSGHEIPGSPYDVANLTECKNKCVLKLACQSIAYDDTNKKCFLHGANKTALPNDFQAWAPSQYLELTRAVNPLDICYAAEEFFDTCKNTSTSATSTTSSTTTSTTSTTSSTTTSSTTTFAATSTTITNTSAVEKIHVCTNDSDTTSSTSSTTTTTSSVIRDENLNFTVCFFSTTTATTEISTSPINKTTSSAPTTTGCIGNSTSFNPVCIQITTSFNCLGFPADITQVDNSNATDCCAQCQERPNCYYYSFNHQQQRCYLGTDNIAVNPFYLSDCVAGTVDRNSCDETASSTTSSPITSSTTSNIKNATENTQISTSIDYYRSSTTTSNAISTTMSGSTHTESIPSTTSTITTSTASPGPPLTVFACGSTTTSSSTTSSSSTTTTTSGPSTTSVSTSSTTSTTTSSTTSSTSTISSTSSTTTTTSSATLAYGGSGEPVTVPFPSSMLSDTSSTTTFNPSSSTLPFPSPSVSYETPPTIPTVASSTTTSSVSETSTSSPTSFSSTSFSSTTPSTASSITFTSRSTKSTTTTSPSSTWSTTSSTSSSPSSAETSTTSSATSSSLPTTSSTSSSTISSSSSITSTSRPVSSSTSSSTSSISSTTTTSLEHSTTTDYAYDTCKSMTPRSVSIDRCCYYINSVETTFSNADNSCQLGNLGAIPNLLVLAEIKQMILTNENQERFWVALTQKPSADLKRSDWVWTLRDGSEQPMNWDVGWGGLGEPGTGAENSDTEDYATVGADGLNEEVESSLFESICAVGKKCIDNFLTTTTTVSSTTTSTLSTSISTSPTITTKADSTSTSSTTSTPYPTSSSTSSTTSTSSATSSTSSTTTASSSSTTSTTSSTTTSSTTTTSTSSSTTTSTSSTTTTSTSSTTSSTSSTSTTSTTTTSSTSATSSTTSSTTTLSSTTTTSSSATTTSTTDTKSKTEEEISSNEQSTLTTVANNGTKGTTPGVTVADMTTAKEDNTTIKEETTTINLSTETQETTPAVKRNTAEEEESTSQEDVSNKQKATTLKLTTIGEEVTTLNASTEKGKNTTAVEASTLSTAEDSTTTLEKGTTEEEVTTKKESTISKTTTKIPTTVSKASSLRITSDGQAALIALLGEAIPNGILQLLQDANDNVFIKWLTDNNKRITNKGWDQFKKNYTAYDIPKELLDKMVPWQQKTLSKNAVDELTDLFKGNTVPENILDDIEAGNDTSLLDWLKTKGIRFDPKQWEEFLNDAPGAGVPNHTTEALKTLKDARIPSEAVKKLEEYFKTTLPEDVIAGIEKGDNQPLNVWLEEEDIRHECNAYDDLSKQPDIPEETIKELKGWDNETFCFDQVDEINKLTNKKVPEEVLQELEKGNEKALTDWMNDEGLRTSLERIEAYKQKMEEMKLPPYLPNELIKFQNGKISVDAVEELDAFAGKKVPKGVLESVEKGDTFPYLDWLESTNTIPSDEKLQRLREEGPKKGVPPGMIPKVEIWHVYQTTTTVTTPDPKYTTPPLAPGQTTTMPIPLSEGEKKAVTAMQTIGCAVLIAVLIGTIVVYGFIVQDKSIERFLHMNHEIALLIGHILILTMRDRPDLPVPCKVVSIALQWMFTTVFAFMFLEGLQAYAIGTSIIGSGGVLNYKQNFVAGWGLSGVYTGVSAMFFHTRYVSAWSCWLNMGHGIAAATVLPIGVLSAMTIIMAEAGGMGEHEMLPDACTTQRSAAVANQKGLLFVLPANVASWFVGLWAVYNANIALYGTVFALNTTLAVVIFVFHTLGNPKVHAMFTKCMGRG